MESNTNIANYTTVFTGIFEEEGSVTFAQTQNAFAFTCDLVNAISQEATICGAINTEVRFEEILRLSLKINTERRITEIFINSEYREIAQKYGFHSFNGEPTVNRYCIL